MRKRRMAVLAAALLLGLCLVSGAQAADVNGCMSMTKWDRQTTLLEERLDVDGDGVGEIAYFDQYANLDYRVVAFFGADSGHDLQQIRQAALYLCPGITYCDGNGFSKGTFAGNMDCWEKDYLNLSLLTGDDGRLYACTDGVIFLSDRLQESYPEFFVSDSGRGEMQPIEVDYQSFLMDQLGHVTFLPYPIGFRAEYVEALGRWCLVMDQASMGEYGAPYQTLRTCLAMEDGALKKLARFLDGERVE